MLSEGDSTVVGGIAVLALDCITRLGVGALAPAGRTGLARDLSGVIENRSFRWQQCVRRSLFWAR